MLCHHAVEEGVEIGRKVVEVTGERTGRDIARHFSVLLDLLSEAPPLSVASNLCKL